MSIRAMTYVWDNSPSKGGRLLVLLALADHANDDFITWPKVKKLTQKSRLSERQVERVLRELERDGEIEAPPRLRDISKKYPIRIRQNVERRSSPATENPSPTSKDPVAGDGDDPTSATGPSREPSGEPPSSTTRTQEIEAVFTAYVEATGKKVRLDDKRRRIINNALDVARGDNQAARLAKCKAAVIGLSKSPHHLGENEQRKEYLEIRYALKGIRDESDDERIEKMAALAAGASPSGIDRARVDRRLEEVRANRSSGGNWEPARAARAKEELESWGYIVNLLDEPPWAQLDRP